MKILFVSLLLPHPYADHASAFTVLKMIKHLSKKHEVSLVSFVRSEKEREYVKHIKDYCHRVETVLLPQSLFRKLWVRAKLLGLKPVCVSNSYCRQMRDCIRSLCRSEKFDIVQAEYTPMGQYVSEVGESAAIINVHDLIHVTAKRFVKNLAFSQKKLEWFADSLVCRRYESQLYSRFNHVLALSKNIKEHLLSLDASMNVSVIQPGVDIPEMQKSHSQGVGRNLIFMGAMWRPENIDAVLYFYHSIFGPIREAVPDVVLHIVGGSPSEEIRKLGSDSHVKVSGYVNDLLPYYLQSDVSIAPVRIAGGVMCKILDAMAAGLPVITTTEGNEGIGAEPGEEIIVADTPKDFANSTIEMLKDGHRRKTLSQKGVDFVRSNFSWEQAIRKIESIYQECLSSQRENRSPNFESSICIS